MAEDAPLCLLLLDGVLEEGPFARRAEDLRRAPTVLAVEPSRTVPAMLAGGVAKRLTRRLPGAPRVVILVGEPQRALARALVARHPGCELWIAGEDFDAADDPARGAHELNAELWDRLEALGVARR